LFLISILRVILAKNKFPADKINELVDLLASVWLIDFSLIIPPMACPVVLADVFLGQL